jgi:hypothetical protein
MGKIGDRKGHLGYIQLKLRPRNQALALFRGGAGSSSLDATIPVPIHFHASHNVIILIVNGDQHSRVPATFCGLA